jgi:hypothetical protein
MTSLADSIDGLFRKTEDGVLSTPELSQSPLQSKSSIWLLHICRYIDPKQFSLFH